MSNYKAYFALESKLKRMGLRAERSELVSSFTKGAKSGLSQLTPQEYKAFIRFLQTMVGSKTNQERNRDWQNTPQNRMRRKVYALLVHKLGYEESEMHQWVKKYSAAKCHLQKHSYGELVSLVSQIEQMFQKELDRI